MQKLISIIKTNLENDFDSVTAVSGSEGVGKSTLTIELGMGLDNLFRIDRNVILQPTAKEVFDRIFGLPKYSPVIVDEAMRTMYKRDFMSGKSRMLNTIFSVCRKQNKPVFLNIPNFFDLDSYYRNHRVKVWIYVPKRGLAMVFMRDPSPFVKDPWYKDENQKMIDNYMRRKKFDIPTLIRALRNSKNYVYEFEFPDLTDKAKTLYKMEYEKIDPREMLKADKWEIRFKKLIELLWKINVIKKVDWENKVVVEGKMFTQTELSNLLDMGRSTLANYIVDETSVPNDSTEKIYNYDNQREIVSTEK